MSNRLATFSGKFGDILWSLATVRQLALRYNKQLDFACMPQYVSLIPLILNQEYIDHAFVLNEWTCTGSPHGDQPWQAPVSNLAYEEVFHLTYQRHPSPTPLALFIAQQNGVQLDGSPFLDTQHWEQWAKGVAAQTPYIAYAFNPLHAEQKLQFLAQLQVLCKQGGESNPLWGFEFLDLTQYEWVQTPALIDSALAFVGCRSANYVIAHGVGQKVVCYEPEPWRTECTYGYPYGTEKLCMNSEVAHAQLLEWVKDWKPI
jgi:hypothetical protein